MGRNWKQEWKKPAIIAGIFLACFYMPVGAPRFDNAVIAALFLVKRYAREFILFGLVPALCIAGAVIVFVNKGSILKYLGPKANKALAYGVASVSGSVLAVCSCAVLPLFAGIVRMGAGLGPACAFLYAGPAINILAIVLTARVLGFQLGIARAVGAIGFSVIIGMLMHVIFPKEGQRKIAAIPTMAETAVLRPWWKNALVFLMLIVVTVFISWSYSGKLRFGLMCCPGGHQMDTYEGRVVDETDTTVTVRDTTGKDNLIEKQQIAEVEYMPQAKVIEGINSVRHFAAISSGLFLVAMLMAWFKKHELADWAQATWGLCAQILPLLLVGVLLSGLLLGYPGREGLIPGAWVERTLGTNTSLANLFASVAGTFMYFATLTEVPVVQGLLGAGMGKGPALALLLAGPALSLPNMLVIHSVLGAKKTLVFVLLVIVMATISGFIFGEIWG